MKKNINSLSESPSKETPNPFLKGIETSRVVRQTSQEVLYNTFPLYIQNYLQEKGQEQKDFFLNHKYIQDYFMIPEHQVIGEILLTQFKNLSDINTIIGNYYSKNIFLFGGHENIKKFLAINPSVEDILEICRNHEFSHAIKNPKTEKFQLLFTICKNTKDFGEFFKNSFCLSVLKKTKFSFFSKLLAFCNNLEEFIKISSHPSIGEIAFYMDNLISTKILGMCTQISDVLEILNQKEVLKNIQSTKIENIELIILFTKSNLSLFLLFFKNTYTKRFIQESNIKYLAIIINNFSPGDFIELSAINNIRTVFGNTYDDDFAKEICGTKTIKQISDKALQQLGKLY